MDETAFKGGILALFSTAGSSFTKVRKDLSLMKHSAGKENGLRLGIKWFGFVLICWFCLLQVKCLSLCSSWERWINPFRRWIFQWPKSKVYIFFFPLQIFMGLIWSKIYLKLISNTHWSFNSLPRVLPPELSGLACDVLDKLSASFCDL